MRSESPLHIYVVDDDAAARRSLCALLSAHGYETAAHKNAEEFLAAFDGRTDACLLLDLRMGGMNGLELQRHLGKIAARLPIIVITAHGDVPAAVRAIKNGAIDFIEKPIPEERLLEAIAAAKDLLGSLGAPKSSARDCCRATVATDRTGTGCA